MVQWWGDGDSNGMMVGMMMIMCDGSEICDHGGEDGGMISIRAVVEEEDGGHGK